MIGIYLITNNVNNKKYVGQSVDIERRISEHLRGGQPEKYSSKNERDSKTAIHLAMQKYGVNNFSFNIIEQCKKEELDSKEIYWINYYDSYNNGYNETKGGQKTFALVGENHSQAKLSQQDVNNIKYLLSASNQTLDEINVLYPYISKSTLSLINNGKIWFDENQKYPIRKMIPKAPGEKNGRAKFTDEQVKQMRLEYSQGMRLGEIQEKYNHIASNSAIKAIIYGETYKHLPIWKNKTKEWI